MANTTTNGDMLFLEGAGKLVDKVDFYVKEFNDSIAEMNRLKRRYDTKDDKFSGINGIIYFVIIAIVLLIPTYLISLLIGIYALIIWAIVSVTLYALRKKRYTEVEIKEIESSYDKDFKKEKEKAERSFIAIKAMEPEYKVFQADIEEGAYNVIAIEIMYESTRQGYCDNLEDAYIFYKRRRDYLPKCRNKKVRELMPIIINSERLQKKRNEYFEKYKSKEDFL